MRANTDERRHLQFRQLRPRLQDEIVGTAHGTAILRRRRRRAAAVVDAVAETSAPIVRIVLAVTTDQRLILLAEVEPQATPDAVEVAFAEAAFREQRGHDAMAHRDAVFAAERQRVLAAEIAVANKQLEIVLQVIVDVYLIEEPGLDLIGLDDVANRRRRGVAELDAANPLQRPAPVVQFAFRADVIGANAAGLIPKSV